MRMGPRWIRMGIKIHSAITSTFSLFMKIEAKHNSFFWKHVICSTTTMSKFKSEIHETDSYYPDQGLQLETLSSKSLHRNVRGSLIQTANRQCVSGHNQWFCLSKNIDKRIHDSCNSRWIIHLSLIIGKEYLISPLSAKHIKFSIEPRGAWIFWSCIWPDKKF